MISSKLEFIFNLFLNHAQTCEAARPDSLVRDKNKKIVKITDPLAKKQNIESKKGRARASARLDS